jgi:hypothetical protein
MNSGGRFPSSIRARGVTAHAQTRHNPAGRLLGALALAAALAAFGPSRATAQGVLPDLVAPPTAAESARYSLAERRPGPGVVRQRPVGVDLRRLDDRAGFAPGQLRVELFDARAVILEKDRVERRGDADFTWHGKIEGHPNGYALLTIVNGQVSGTIDLGDTGRAARSRYLLESTNDGLTLLREIDESAFPDDHPPVGDPIAPRSTLKSLIVAPADKTGVAEGALTKADSGATVDVMVVYSNQTAAAAGSAIGAQIQQAIDTANLVYANSGITTRLRLVHYEPANYDESGDFPTDLNRITSATDGYMSGVPALRDAYGADLVSLFVESSQYCGYAWIGPSAAYGFSVINRGCASSNYSFPHELGHNFGARHDAYVDNATTPYAYGHGWVDVGERWRDVMAYNNACAAAGVTCTRIPYFSNPAMTYGTPADPLGSTSTADVVRVHNQNAVTVANFRQTVGGAGSCSYALAPASASVAAGSGSASIGVTTQSGCAWNPVSNAAWLSAASTASGSGTLAYSYAANSGPARSGVVTVGGIAFTVNQASGCVYSLNPGSASVGAASASGTTALTTTAGCTWSASSSASWLSITTAASGSGSASVGYAVSANAGAARSANLTIGGRTFVVSQAAATVTPAVASVSPASLDFGTITLGKASAAKVSTLTNTGGSTLTLSSITQSGASDFKRGGTCAVNTALASGQSCTLSVTFTPTVASSRSAAISVGTTGGTVTLSLTGTGKKAGRK